MKKITYSQVGDNYDTKDPTKILAQKAASSTAIHLTNQHFLEVEDTRGESAYVWKQGGTYMASVIEGLGTKNLIADKMRSVTWKTYYDIMAHDTVATIINDLVSVGARPLVLHAYWAIEDNSWLTDEKRMTDLITGWKKACDIAKVTWGGGETPTLKNVLQKDAIDLGGSAVGIIPTKKQLITDKNLKLGDQILLIRSNGINANGVSLARALAKKLPKGYATKLPSGMYYGDALLTKTNIYATLIQDLFHHDIIPHYISNITGHGFRKIMRARPHYSYIIEKIFEPLELFTFMQEVSKGTDEDMYGSLNMGMDYAIFLSEKNVKEAQKIIKHNGFESIHAGYVEKGQKQVVIKPKNIVFQGETLGVR